ncbi:MAG: SPFH domain-containing protein [Anaerolineae bacterium]|nr:SPFH domain-containing protein [Anaerolineae bacterium]
MGILLGIAFGALLWFIRTILPGLFTVQQNERAVKTSFGRAQRIDGRTTLDDPVSNALRQDERSRYAWPQVQVIPPGGPYIRWPWEKVYKAQVAVQTINMALDIESPQANSNGTMLEAVTKDQLNTGLQGQIRYRVSESNLYAYLFGVKNPIVHVMGYFVSILRERIANFEAPTKAKSSENDINSVAGVSINDLRKNLRTLNEYMDLECSSSAARYGLALDASLITAIDSPPEVESALAAINTAHNHVSSDISLAQASADQKIVQSRRAVEIETLKATAETEPLNALARQLHTLKESGANAVPSYLRYIQLGLYNQAQRIIKEVK